MKSGTLLFLLLFSLTSFAQKAVHSHNDYEQSVPFWNAFNAGASSIEADVILLNQDLMVSHDTKGIKQENTLENLYLKPLSIVLSDRKIKRFDLLILIDIKTEAISTLNVLIAQLEKYPHLINSGATNKKISFVISGNRPPPEKYKDYPPYFNFDYQIVDVWPIDMSKVALVSLPFYKYCKWNGSDDLKETDYSTIKEIVTLVHSKGKKLRFWATPDSELAWKQLSKLSVDYINTDNPKDCINFLEGLRE